MYCYSQVKSNILFATAVLFLMPGLDGVLAIGVPVYSILLMTMIWRATARVQFFEASIVVCSIGSVITAYKLGYWKRVGIFFYYSTSRATVGPTRPLCDLQV